MKRKKASKNSHKKAKKEKITVAIDSATSPSNTNGDEELASDDKHVSPTNSKNKLELPSISPDETSNPANSDTATTSEASLKQPVYTRVKVKLKSSKTLKPSKTSTDHEKAVLPTSDTSMEKKEGSNYSDGRISDLQPLSSGKSPRKAGSIKIISSRGMLSSNFELSEKRKDDNERTAESSVHIKYRRRDVSAPRADPRYNENELKSSLVVIKKIMRMEAAEPFNAPVDPIALGIPDYFEVIETPMDFGTICKDLENGQKYLNSKDVFRDVQFIWENCYKYNNKGDYIMDLMKRVKRNFMKYWTAAELSTDISEPVEGAQGESSNKEKESKAKSSKSKRKRYGIDLHKSGCLCAVCVVRRRRREREEQSELTETQTETSDNKLTVDLKEEKIILGEKSPSERSSSSTDEILEHDDMAGMEEGEKDEAMETVEMKREMSEMAGDESPPHPPDEDLSLVHEHTVNGEDSSPAKDENLPTSTEGELPSPEEDQGRESRGEELEQSLYEDPSRVENLAVVEICHALFCKDSSSVWRGPHSLTPRTPFKRHTPIHAALSSLFRR